MKISTDHGYENDFIATNDQVIIDVNKFRNHPSIIMIKNKKKNDKSFSFVSSMLFESSMLCSMLCSSMFS